MNFSFLWILSMRKCLHITRKLYSACELFASVYTDKIHENEVHFCSTKDFLQVKALCIKNLHVIWKILTLVLLKPDMPCLCKQCRSRSVGFSRSQLIWICTVWHYLIYSKQSRSSNLIGCKLEVSGHGILIYSAGQGLNSGRVHWIMSSLVCPLTQLCMGIFNYGLFHFAMVRWVLCLLNNCHGVCKFSRWQIDDIFLIFSRKYALTFHANCLPKMGRPRWLSWMRRPTGDQEVAGSTPTEVGNILSWRLIMKYFLLSFSPFRWFKKGSCQFLAKECAQYWLTA